MRPYLVETALAHLFVMPEYTGNMLEKILYQNWIATSTGQLVLSFRDVSTHSLTYVGVPGGL